MKFRRRRLLLLPALVLLMGNQDCNLNNMAIEKVIAKTGDAVKPYFPNAKVTTRGDVIIALACTGDDVGPAFIRKVEQMVPTLGGISLLEWGRRLSPLAGVAGVQTYKYIGLGFGGAIVRYDVDAKVADIIIPPADYAQWYARECGLTYSPTILTASDFEHLDSDDSRSNPAQSPSQPDAKVDAAVQAGAAGAALTIVLECRHAKKKAALDCPATNDPNQTPSKTCTDYRKKVARYCIGSMRPQPEPLQEAAAPSTPAAASPLEPPVVYAWIGQFKVDGVDAGHSPQTRTVNYSLGVWTRHDFTVYRDQEVAMRRHQLAVNYAKAGLQVRQVMLLKAIPVPITQSMIDAHVSDCRTLECQ